MTKVFKESVPANARITIDYKKKDVKFDYLRRYSGWDKFAFILSIVMGTYMLLIALIAVPIMLFIAGISALTSLTTSVATTSLTATVVTLEIIHTISIMVLVFGVPILISLMIYFNSEKYSHWLPIIARFISEKIFGTKKVIIFRKIKTKIVKIPIFKNVMLDYKATKDYAKYLSNVKIREYGIDIMSVSRFGKRKMEKIRPAESWWNAIFEFTQVPKKGKLEVYFI